jgi:predicted nuclease of predicted toxin-antitoxin system
MRVLADENFPKSVVDLLRAAGHDVLWARTECCGWKDAALLDLAESEERLIFTLDKDFWQIAMQRRAPIQKSGVILFRIHPATPNHLGRLVQAFLKVSRQWSGHISVVAPDGIQMLAVGRPRSG